MGVSRGIRHTCHCLGLATAPCFRDIQSADRTHPGREGTLLGAVLPRVLTVALNSRRTLGRHTHTRSQFFSARRRLCFDRPAPGSQGCEGDDDDAESRLSFPFT